eukprot:CAMPEP_0176412162 /NCGR_PEP_ID=MMETSP0127-20121128/3994_1 /TAXON_ID=938130 /ORGANISM="Platyophrya macrostoma, Strain WH" /LENGTH=115 /DNA_ID=CAMNT_0017791809 /DNA_START=315 /DNA_END=659 /DNA_ORIENTATION=+
MLAALIEGTPQGNAANAMGADGRGCAVGGTTNPGTEGSDAPNPPRDAAPELGCENIMVDAGANADGGAPVGATEQAAKPRDTPAPPCGTASNTDFGAAVAFIEGAPQGNAANAMG